MSSSTRSGSRHLTRKGRIPNRSDTGRLADLARRWTRFAVIGLPGRGKSTALEQLAAAWAEDLEAPLPIVVRLHTLVSRLRDRQSVSLEDLCRLADSATDDVVPALAERLERGTAALFLDGLDECRDQQGPAVAWIRRLTRTLGPETGLVVSAREAASRQAHGTGLPMMMLKEPDNLKDRVRALADHVARAENLQITDDEIGQRREWIKESQSRHPDVWRIPLFAVLLAVHATRASAEDLPTTRAGALTAAISDSVDHWERRKAYDPRAWDPDLYPEMLIDGFAAIGHAIVTETTDSDAALQAVADNLATPWSLPRAAPALWQRRSCGGGSTGLAPSPLRETAWQRGSRFWPRLGTPCGRYGRGRMSARVG